MQSTTTEIKKELKELRERIIHISNSNSSFLYDVPVAYALCKIQSDKNMNSGKIVVLNASKRFEELVARPIAKIKGQSLKNILFDHDDTWFDSIDHSLITNGTTKFEEYSRPQQKWYEFNISCPDGSHLLVILNDITEYKQGEVALLERDNILLEMGKMAMIGGWEHDLITRKATWTETLYDIVEIDSGEDPPGVDEHLNYYPEEYRMILKSHYDKAVDDHIPFSLDIKFNSSSGKEKWARVYGEPVIENNKAVRLRGFFQDITHIKQAEYQLTQQNEEYLAINEEYIAINDELSDRNAHILSLNDKLRISKQEAEHSEALYRTIFNTIKEGVFIYSSVDKLEYVNPAGSRMHGRSQKELTSMKPIEFIHPDTYQVFLDFITAIDANEEFHDEASGLTREGDRFDVEVFGCGINIDGQKLYYSTIRDVTQQRKFEIDIKKKNEYINDILTLNPNHIYIYDIKEMNLVYANRRVEEYLGYTPDEVTSISSDLMATFVHPDDVEAHKKHVEMVANSKEGDRFTREYRLRHKNGNYIWFHANELVFKRDQDGSVRQIIGASVNITEMKLIKQQLEEQNKEMLAQNEEYMALNEELEESNHKLVKVNEELDSFVYRVSHDLRAPIASSMGLALLMLRENNTELNKKYSQLQVDSLIRLDNYIKDILNYSRNARLDVDVTKLNLEELVKDIVDSLHDFDKKRQTIEFRLILSGSPFIHSDKLRIKIILNNLLSNAFKYYNERIEKSYVEVKIDQLEKYTKISIADNGIGIKPEYQDRIFEMFFRATDRRHGSGIGLYIVKDCMKKIEGNITFKSIENKGTQFVLTIPNVKSG